ncbi:MAG: hypothetical protein LC721_06315 [Actinobacteria bacterium]|nr:hypothetical protein [Actinomycetota bacterium]
MRDAPGSDRATTVTGALAVVGLGPGGPAHRTRAAEDAVRDAQVVLGYQAYLAACADLTGPHQSVVPSGIGAEQQRVDDAVRAAAGGARVALVSSGDAGIYGMASLALTTAAALAPDRRPAVRVVPGITAAVAAAALLTTPAPGTGRGNWAGHARSWPSTGPVTLRSGWLPTRDGTVSRCSSPRWPRWTQPG